MGSSEELDIDIYNNTSFFSNRFKVALLWQGVSFQQSLNNNPATFLWKYESWSNDNNLQDSKSCLNLNATFWLKSQTSQLIIFKIGISNVLHFLLIKILLNFISYFFVSLAQMVVVDLSGLLSNLYKWDGIHGRGTFQQILIWQLPYLPYHRLPHWILL